MNSDLLFSHHYEILKLVESESTSKIMNSSKRKFMRLIVSLVTADGNAYSLLVLICHS